MIRTHKALKNNCIATKKGKQQTLWRLNNGRGGSRYRTCTYTHERTLTRRER